MAFLALMKMGASFCISLSECSDRPLLLSAMLTAMLGMRGVSDLCVMEIKDGR